MKICLKKKYETKECITFWLYVNNSQSIMTLDRQAFAEFCSLLSKGKVGMPLKDVISDPGSCLKV